MQACGVLVTVPPAPRADATYEGLCLTGRPLAVEGDPAGSFFASFRVLGTVDFFASDGQQVLMVGVRSGGDTVAQTRDGRFACTGAACDELRCIVEQAAASSRLQAVSFPVVVEHDDIQKMDDALREWLVTGAGIEQTEERFRHTASGQVATHTRILFPCSSPVNGKATTGNPASLAALHSSSVPRIPAMTIAQLALRSIRERAPFTVATHVVGWTGEPCLSDAV